MALIGSQTAVSLCMSLRIKEARLKDFDGIWYIRFLPRLNWILVRVTRR